MYWLNPKSLAFSGWKPFPSFFNKIVQAKTTSATVERQINRKFKTRDKAVTNLAVGRWFIKRENWNLEKLQEIFRADTKRHRSTYDSYTLFLNDESAQSESWNAQQLNDLYEHPWQFKKTVTIKAILETEENDTLSELEYQNLG
jgi:type IV secretory pathway component VirB8